MSERPEYKPTLFDRHGADAGIYLKACGYGLMVFGITLSVILLKVGFKWWILPVSAIAGAFPATVGLLIAGVVGGSWKLFLMGGNSTPYTEQYSFQDALVMQGKLDEALESFEAIIREQPNAVDAHIRAAELYAREKGDAGRAAELFRAAQRIATIPPGEDVYVSNRLVDLLVGPLGDAGRALVELRRLIDRHPGTTSADNARSALARLKAHHFAEGADSRSLSS